MEKQYLNQNWKVTADKIGTIEASVPGCIHTDLIQNGLIQDLFWRDNNLQYEWIENCNFTYFCRFNADCSKRAVLTFEGLDTYCSIVLNGEQIGEADDMFIPYSFDVTGKLKTNDNLLEVKFRSPIKEVENRPLYKAAFTQERINTRRMQCTYGWDWVDRFVTCGIYRPVFLNYGSDIHVESAYLLTENIDCYSAQIYMELEMANYTQGGLAEIEIIAPDEKTVCHTSVFVKEPKLVRRFDIENPQLWYPLGYGEHPLYTLRVTVNDNVFTETFGIRTLKILQVIDSEESEYFRKSKALQQTPFGKMVDQNKEFRGFQVIVNGKKILCHGANWVPSEPFPSAETREKFEHLIDLAKQMHVNILRVWGGGVFEDRYFYDLCDRSGILVLQDFLMACGTYPEEEEWFLERLRQESLFAVKYLRNHPSLAWWQGDNENATEGNDTLENYCGRTAALHSIAPAIYKFDHGRPFLASSPYGGDMYASLTSGTTHNTNYVGEMYEYFCNEDCLDYKEFFSDFTARFISEEPTFGAVSRRSALRFMTEEDIFDPEQTILRHHTKNNPELIETVFDSITTFALKVLGQATDAEDRYFKYKYIQYEWVRLSFENLRKNIGYCNGLIFWMFDDCWPAALGWSFVDYYGIPKASFYAFRRAAQAQTVSVEEQDGGYAAIISNSSLRDIKGTLTAICLSRTAGFSVIDRYEMPFAIGEYAAKAWKLPFQAEEDRVVVCEIQTEENTDRSFYQHGGLAIENCTDALHVINQTETQITLSADRYIHAVEIEADALFSDNYFSLLPGEERTITWKWLPNVTDHGVSLTAYTLKK